ncbi:MAG TPA: hypothetical protein VK196_02895 [Magnetospirillum sp.]|nr:hypothetical protein [Magnetospirillum sp.]
MGSTSEALMGLPYFAPAAMALLFGRNIVWGVVGAAVLELGALGWTVAACSMVDNAMAPAAFGLMFMASFFMTIVALGVRALYSSLRRPR